MYSPKIKEELIPYLYRLSRHLGQPMTRTVDQIIGPVIEHYRETGIFQEIEAEEKLLRSLTTHIKKLIDQRHTRTAEVIELLKKIA